MIYACLAGHAGPGDGAGGRAALKRSKPLEYPNALVETQGHAAELEGKLNKREAEVERLRSALHEAGVDTQTLMGSDPVRHPALPILEFRVYLVWGFAEANTRRANSFRAGQQIRCNTAVTCPALQSI